MTICVHIRLGSGIPLAFSGSCGACKDQLMDRKNIAAGHAALAICESLLLSLTEAAILSVDEARSILEDAAAANRNAIPLEADGEQHRAAAERIELILAGRNSVRIE